MKLQKLVESQNMTDEEIVKYISKFSYINSLKINDDKSIEVNSLKITDEDLTDFKINILKATEVVLTNCALKDFSFIPKSMSSLTFRDCYIPDIFYLKTQIKDFFAIESLHSKVNEINISLHDTRNVGFDFKYITYVKKIIIDNQSKTIPRIMLKNVNAITHFSEIVTQSPITVLDVQDNNILNFSSIEKLNMSTFLMEAYSLNSWRGIENTTAEVINIKELNHLKNYNNIINVLIPKSKTILLSSKSDIKFSDTRKIREILIKYIKMSTSNRSENIMDCAIELIEAGYEEAAEL